MEYLFSQYKDFEEYYHYGGHLWCTTIVTEETGRRHRLKISKCHGYASIDIRKEKAYAEMENIQRWYSFYLKMETALEPEEGEDEESDKEFEEETETGGATTEDSEDDEVDTDSGEDEESNEESEEETETVGATTELRRRRGRDGQRRRCSRERDRKKLPPLL